MGHRPGPDSPLPGHRPREQPGPSRQGHHRCAVLLARPRIAHLDGILRTGLLAYFDTGGASDGPTEATNLLIETTRRTGYGFRNFDNHRLRLLLADGGTTCDRERTRIRRPRPRFVA